MRGRDVATLGVSLLVAGTGALAATGGQDSRGPDAAAGDRGGRAVTVDVRDADGDRVGVVRLRERWGSVEVDAQFWSLTEGFHGFHVHETARCAPNPGEGPFTAAGGHHNPAGKAHAEHAGDLPSVLVEASGRARLSFTTDRFTLVELKAGDGSAVMVHAGRDNFANIPADRYSSTTGESVPDKTTRDTGDAGSRAACGEIRPGR
jgi:Cu-Zn family superoxide dismutase